jgi:uncharacterized protein (TIGR03382 family)
MWTIGGVDALEGADATASLALILANTTPGQHTFIPTPGALALLAMGGVAGLRRRR